MKIIPELATVRLTRQVGDRVAGTVGTVVLMYDEGDYEVEFPDPTVFLTLKSEDIEEVELSEHDGVEKVLRAARAPIIDEPMSADEMMSAIRKRTDWRPIETAPKDGTVVLLLGAGGEREVGCWNPNGDSWVDEDGNSCEAGQGIIQVTGSWSSCGGWFQPNEVVAWAPIPDVPKGMNVRGPPTAVGNPLGSPLAITESDRPDPEPINLIVVEQVQEADGSLGWSWGAFGSGSRLCGGSAASLSVCLTWMRVYLLEKGIVP